MSVLGPGAEFDVIRRLVAQAGEGGPGVHVGPGDDAAVIEGGWVLSTDLSVEDVHFRRAWLSETEIGYRAACAALSDLAAMGAEPVAAMVSIAAPDGGDLAEAIGRGAAEAVRTYGGAVIGGDLSGSPGPIFVDVTVVGRASWPVLRGGAVPGNEIWVTGTLGAAAGAVRVWKDGGTPSDELREAYARPAIRVKEVGCLVEQEVADALVDISDGLVADLGHVAAASDVRVVIESALVPVSPHLTGRFDSGKALDLALRGGEDYEVAFACDAGAVDPDDLRERHRIVATRVGRVEEGGGVWIESEDGSVTAAGVGGFDHFGEGAS